MQMCLPQVLTHVMNGMLADWSALLTELKWWQLTGQLECKVLQSIEAQKKGTVSQTGWHRPTCR